MVARIPAARELKRQIAAARRAEAEARAVGRRAQSVSFDQTRRRVVLELTNGLQVSIPLVAFPDVARAAPEALQAVALSPSGAGIEWRDLDADYSVPGLLAWVAGAQAGATALGRIGGGRRSAAKAAAARANGARGGRPRSRR